MSDRRLALLIVSSVAAAVLAALGSSTAAAFFAALAAVLATWLAAKSRVPDDRMPPIERRGDAAAAAVEAREVADLHGLVSALTEGVLLIGGDGEVLLANAAAATILQRPSHELTGGSLIRATREAELAEAARSPVHTPVDIEITGGRRIRVTSSRVNFGEVEQVLVLDDLSALDRAERARTDLVANVSHELRTPLTAVRAIAETIQAGIDDPEQRRHFVDQLVSEIERLISMVERLLYLARLESRTVSFDLESLAPDELLREAAARFEPLLTRREVQLEVSVDDGGRVLADRARTVEVLSNLLENALRYSPNGASISLRAFGLPEEPAVVAFEVADQGPGLLSNERERAFERFYTGDPSRAHPESARGGGSGLGLAIARHALLQMGGRAWFEDPERGAAIRFTLPRSADAA